MQGRQGQSAILERSGLAGGDVLAEDTTKTPNFKTTRPHFET